MHGRYEDITTVDCTLTEPSQMTSGFRGGCAIGTYTSATLTQRYTGKQRFYGDIYPVEQWQKETHVIVKIEPINVSLDAIFKEENARDESIPPVR